MDRRDGSGGWIGGMDRGDGSEGWIGGMDRRDGSMTGLEGCERDGQIEMERCYIVLLILFSQKAKFSHFRGPFSRKTAIIFVRTFAKIYFRPNPTAKQIIPLSRARSNSRSCGEKLN